MCRRRLTHGERDIQGPFRGCGLLWARLSVCGEPGPIHRGRYKVTGDGWKRVGRASAMKPLQPGTYECEPGQYYDSPKEVFGFLKYQKAEPNGAPLEIAQEFLRA